MKTLYMEFSVWATSGQVARDEACWRILNDTSWCAAHKAYVTPLRTRLLLLSLSVPDSYTVPSLTELSTKVGAEVTYASTNFMSTGMVMFIDVCITFVVYVVCIFAVKHATKWVRA